MKIASPSESVASDGAGSAPLIRPEPAVRQKALQLLLFVAVSGVVLNGLANLVLFPHLRQRLAANLETSDLEDSPSFQVLKVFAHVDPKEDSLNTMYPAIQLLVADRRAPVYRTIFFQGHIKFQYSAASLLPYYALARAGFSYHALARISRLFTWSAVWGVLFLTSVIVLRVMGLNPWERESRRRNALLIVAVGLAVLFFGPLVFAFDLGQIQTLLTLGFTTAFYCWMTGREKTAGALIGAMVLVKPQYGLFLLWALLRKRYGAAVACAACVAVGILISCIVFGLQTNLDYIAVLRSIGARGEGFVSNQSMNGLLNRLLFNGDNLRWDDFSYAPFNPIVYAGTLISSLALIGTALFFRWGDRRGRTADFAAILLAATAASPIAWDHHYGILAPILAWMWFGDYAWRSCRRDRVLVALAFLLTANYFLPALALAYVPVANVLESYMYFGALLALFLLFQSRVEELPELAPVAA